MKSRPPSQKPKTPRYDKWGSLRRWVRDVHKEAQQGPVFGAFCDYHRHRAEAFKAVLLVMDVENRRARRSLNQEPKP